MYLFGASSATALATVAVMGATVGTPTTALHAPSDAFLASPESVHVPVLLSTAINTSPTTLGVADSYLYNLSESEVNKTLDELQALGVQDVRIAVPWVYVQPYNAETYDWAKLDVIVDAATQRNMGILGVINATPAWAGALLNGHPDPADFAEFSSAVATRYSGKISAYELWNEPNGVTFYSPVSPEDYTELLKAAYPAIKTADPDAIVIGGVLGAVRTVPGITMAAPTFIQRMYTAGAHGYFDALSYHPYHYTTPFSLGTDPDSPIEQVAAIRNLMAANGDGAEQLWATEYGLPTSAVSETQQAAYIHDFVMSWQHIDGAGPIFIYTTRDSATGAFDDEANFGLFKTNWTRKQAADTVADLIVDLADGTAEPFDVTPYLPGNPFLQGVTVFIRQVINQLLTVPKFVLQVVNSVATALVNFVTTVLHTLFKAPTPTATAVTPKAQEQVAETTPDPRAWASSGATELRTNSPGARRNPTTLTRQLSVPAVGTPAKTSGKAGPDLTSSTVNPPVSGGAQGDDPGEYTGHHRSGRANVRAHSVGSARS